MTLSNTPPQPVPSSIVEQPSSRTVAWHRPIFSPEHGVYVVLLGSFLTGAAAAQQWTWHTTLALISALAAFLAEHPLVLQIRQRRSWKPRFLVWGGLYSGIALGGTIYLALQSPILWWLYLGAFVVLIVDAIAVFYRKQRTIANEFFTFAAVCLTAPLTSIATTGTFSITVVGLWLLNTLFFGSAIFTVKLRKQEAVLIPGVVYHAVAPLLLGVACYYQLLSPITACAFGIALGRFSLVLALQGWYRTTPIQNVARLETLSSGLFLAIACVSLLPAHLPH